jgi:hypothetical protein
MAFNPDCFLTGVLPGPPERGQRPEVGRAR